MGFKSLVAAMTLLATASLSSADVIVSTMASAQGIAGRIGSYYLHSAQFTTDGSAYRLTSVQARVKTSATTHAYIYSDNTGLPGAQLFELVPSAGTSGSYQTVTFEAGAAFELAPDTTYHLVLAAPDDVAAEWALAAGGQERYDGPGAIEFAREYWVGSWQQTPAMLLLYSVNGVVPCPGDFNGDGNINTLDVIGFLNAWSAHAPEGDFNGDGTFNTIDVLGFLNAWSSGC